MNDKKLIINIAVSLGGIFLAVIFGIIMAKTGELAFILIPLALIAIILGYYIVKNPFLGFLLIIFFLPFERVPTLNLGVLDLKINTVLGFLTLFAWIGSLMFNAKNNPPATPGACDWRAGKIQPNAMAVPLGLFVIALLLSVTQAFDTTRSLTVLIFVLFTIVLSIMTVNMLPGVDNLKKVVYVILISATFTGLFGLFQFGGDVIGLPKTLTLLKTGYTSAVFGFPRIQAFSMEPLYYANYLLIPISLTLAYYFGRVKIIKHWWLLAILVLLLVNFVLTLSRGGYLGIGVTFLLFLIFYFKQLFTLRNVAFFFVGVLVFYGVYFALSKGKPDAIKRFTGQATVQDAKNGSDSVQGRLTTFDNAYSVFKKQPLLGIGIGNYGPYVANYPAETPKNGWDVVNNQFIEILAETGVVGALAFVLLMLMIIIRTLMALRKTRDPFLKATMFGLFAAFIGILVQYNFFSTLYIIHIWILIGLLIGVQNLIFKEKDNKDVNQ